MTSLVFHLAVTICFASLAVKVAPRPNSLIVLTGAGADVQHVNNEPTFIELNPVRTSSLDEPDDDPHSTFVHAESLPTPPVEPLTVETDFFGPIELNDEEAPDPAPEQPAERAAEATELVAVVALFEPDSESEDPLDELFGAAGPPADDESTSRQSPSSGFDDIVDRFIQYDIGKLPGKAGQLAQRQFMQLGPEAIPALVRGLNQSASIRASCPVVVLTSKLEQTIRQTDDPALIDYALQNIGRDVFPRAPHASRIEAFKQRLIKQFFRRRFNRDLDKVKPIRTEPRDEWLARVRRLYRADVAAIFSALESEQIEEQTAAWAVLAMRDWSGIRPEERSQLAFALLEQWPRPSTSYQQRIHAALTSLAQSSAVTSDLPRFRRNQTVAVGRRWQQWWNKHGQTNAADAAAELMRLAKYAEARASQRLYSRTIDKFPRTESAKLARHLLTPDAKLKLAQELGEQNRWTEAIGFYEDITADHPDSGAALIAQQRLNELGDLREQTQSLPE